MIRKATRPIIHSGIIAITMKLVPSSFLLVRLVAVLLILSIMSSQSFRVAIAMLANIMRVVGSVSAVVPHRCVSGRFFVII